MSAQAQSETFTTNAAPPLEADPQQKMRLEDFQVADDDHRRLKTKLLLQNEDFKYKQRLAGLFAASGAFADVRGQTPEEALAKAFVKIELGESMGFSPAEAMTGIDIIQGRVAVGANLRAARMQSAGYSWPRMSLTDDGCTIPLSFKGQPMMAPRLDETGKEVRTAAGEVIMEAVVITYGKKDAERAGLLGKDNYKKNPRNMYFARAITNAQRWYAPAVLKADVLTTEEAYELVDYVEPAHAPSAGAAAATQATTSGLAEKLSEKLKATRKKAEPEAATGTSGPVAVPAQGTAAPATDGAAPKDDLPF